MACAMESYGIFPCCNAATGLIRITVEAAIEGHYEELMKWYTQDT